MSVIQEWMYKRRLQRNLRVLINFEDMMKKAGMSRQERRAFWREMAQDQLVRENIIKGIAKRAGVSIEE